MTEVTDNLYSTGQYQGAGMIGFAFGTYSNMQEMFDQEFNAYTLQMSNFTDLTFAQDDYKPVSTTNTMKLIDAKPTDTNVMILPIPGLYLPFLSTT